jgi:preprotein translocase subunit YajC
MSVCSLSLLLAADGAQPGAGSSLWPLLVPFALIFLMYHFMISRPQRKQQAQRQELLNQLKKNDPVVTIGGIIGTVVSLSEDGSEVTVKVDDNTRLKFRKDAIREVIARGEPEKSAST